MAKHYLTTMRKLFLNLPKVVTWLSLTFIVGDSIPVSEVEKLVTRLHVLYLSRGERFLLSYIKDVRSDLLNYLSGNSIRSGNISLTSDGLPKILGSLLPKVRGRSYRNIAMILTVLYSTRSLSIGSPTDISSIVSPPTGDLRNILMFNSDFWKALGMKPVIKVGGKLRANPEMFRSKSGPNGHALATCISDARLLPTSLCDSLTVLGGPRIGWLLKAARSDYIKSFLDSVNVPYIKTEGTSFRRLSSFNDKEDKNRVVAILDWWSQLSLKPLHSYIAMVLKKINQDCTFDQGNFKNSLRSAKVFYSVDLSSATDRFPIELIKGLLGGILPPAYMDAWEQVMVGYPFDFAGEKLSYSTGNPMGAYSSFNSFALAHHYIIYYICRVLGKDWKSLPYALLGDDIVIGDRQVGEMYLEVISQLGLDYSARKTHKSDCFFEFAKRLYLDGVEITPFPVSALKNCGKSVSGLTTLLWEQERRGWTPKTSIPSSVAVYFGIMSNIPNRVKTIKEETSWHVKSVLDIALGPEYAYKYINELIRANGYRLPELSVDICSNIISNCVVEAFADSSVYNTLKNFSDMDIPLRGKSQSLSRAFMLYKQKNRVNSYPDCAIAFSDLPFYLAWKAVVKLYVDLEKKLHKMDTTGETWVIALRSFALPRTDKSILDKGDYLLAKASLQMSKLVKERLVILQDFPQLLDF